MVHIGILFLFGITCFSIVFANQMYGYVFFITFILFLLVGYRILYIEKRPVVISIILLVSGVLLFFYVTHTVLKEKERYQTGFITVSESVTGMISEFPSYRFSNNQYIVSMDNSNTKILVYTQPYQKFSYGEHVQISGKAKDVRGEDGWERYYESLGVQYVYLYPSINSFGIQIEALFQKVKLNLFIFKMYIRRIVLKNFSSHATALILGMLLGEKSELSPEEKNMFNYAGISHILVVSGYNISLVISLFFIIFRFFSRYIRTFISFGAIVLFVLLVGADDSVVRAAIMGSIIIFAQLFHKKSSAIHTLFLAGLLMLLVQPNSLFDIGFHLSFIATFAILTMPQQSKVPEYVFTIIWIFMYMSIYTLYLSERISFVGIISNSMILGIVPLFMLISTFSILLCILKIYIVIDQFVIENFTQYIFIVTHFVQKIPSFQYQISPHIVAVIYVCVLSFVLFLNNRYTTREFIEKHYQKFVPHRTN